MNISFDNTEIAFAYKSNAQLKKARFLFKSMGIGWIVKLGTRLTPWALRTGLPINGLVRKTIFSQFVGGESLEQTKTVVDTLEKFAVKVILDYGVEGKEGEENFEQATDTFIKVIQYSSTQKNIPFISMKLTGLIRFSLLEKLDAAADATSAVEGRVNTGVLTADEKLEWERVENRMDRICKVAAEAGIGVLIDAEESWIQDPVDALAMQMMRKFNHQKAIVYNTAQLYRHDRLQFTKDSIEYALANNFIPGMKLVRGAYMEKERKRAAEKGYPSPIQPDKEYTDKDYDGAVEYCIERLDKLYLIVASHNEQSNMYAAELESKQEGSHSDHLHFSQLYGMSDNITFNLAREGFSVSKYLPFGPIKDVIPYLMRRAQENSSVKGQTGRELGLIKKELKRRSLGQ